MRLIALVGLPGAGKSTLARAIARSKQWPIVDRDALSRQNGKETATRAALAEVRRHLEHQQSCVLDGMTLATAAQRDEVRGIAGAAGAQSMLVWLDCPTDVAISRVAAQADHPASDRTAALIAEVAARFEKPESDVVHLDATQEPEELFRQIAPLL